MLPIYPVSATRNSCKCLLRGKLPGAHCGFCTELKGSGQPCELPGRFHTGKAENTHLHRCNAPFNLSHPPPDTHTPQVSHVIPRSFTVVSCALGLEFPTLFEHRNLSRRGLEGNRGSQESCCYCYKSQCSALPGSSVGLGSFF